MAEVGEWVEWRLATFSEITIEAIGDYAAACIKVQEQCELLQDDGYHFMVVPSRGAAPIEKAASDYFFRVRRYDVLRKSAFGATIDFTQNPLCNPLYLPFTADIPEEETGINSRNIRSFWAKVLAAIVRGDLTDAHYAFYAFLRLDVARLGFKHMGEERLRSGKFVFLDTVISGRAICEILDAFEQVGLTECHFILIIDEGGRKLDPLARARLETLSGMGRATLIYMERLFTEDRGPAMSGIWCVTMPEVMNVARDLVPEFKSSGDVGAGLYYVEVQQRKDGSNANMTMAIATLNLILSTAVDNRMPHRSLDWHLADYHRHLEKHTLFTPGATADFAKPRIKQATSAKHKLEVSGSHAIRLQFDKDIAARFVRDFLRTRPIS